MEKKAALPGDWLRTRFLDEAARSNHRANHVLGEIPEDIPQFDGFYERRRDALRERLTALLAGGGEPVAGESAAIDVAAE